MRYQTVRRAGISAVVLSLIVAAAAFADTVSRDADTLTEGIQSSRNLGNVSPGTVVNVPVRFSLACGGSQHVDPGQGLQVEIGSAVVPAGGAVAMAPITVGPVPLVGWPADGAECVGTPTPLEATGTVAVTAPTLPGPYTYSIIFKRTPTPAGSSDGTAISSGTTAATFTLTVVPNTAPQLSLPADMTVEGNATGGWTAAWTVTATDAEDDPDPVATCAPAIGALLPLGTTTVNCSVTDSGALTTTGSFHVTVADTTPPTLSGVPADLAVVSADPAGAVATYANPTATDIVDAAPAVGCLPVSGSTFAPGATTVTCTATDASGNVATGTFVVSVSASGAAAPPAPTALPTVVFGPPIKGDGLDGHAGRTIPMKVRLLLDGASVGDGSLVLVITHCDGGEVVGQVDMAWQAGSERWFGHWRTRGLEPGCYSVRAMHDGTDVGGIEVRLSGKGRHAAASNDAAITHPKAKGGRTDG